MTAGSGELLGKSAQDIISYTARVSNPNNQLNFETSPKLLKYLIKHKHWSPFEMASVTLELTTSRGVAAQILRHRSFTFQEFCVAGDTQITTITKGNSKKIRIDDLYKRYKSSYWKRASNYARVFDENTKTFIPAKIKEVFDTGVKEVFKLTLENGKNVTATKDHKFLTFSGFLPLENINTETFIACNGIPVYQDKSWLQQAKVESFDHGGLVYIAEKANVSYHTIRKWLRIHGIQYTRAETSKYKKVWNKGLPQEMQPLFGKVFSQETRDKMSKMARRGTASNLYKNGNGTIENLPFRKKVSVLCKKHHYNLLLKQNFICPVSNRKISMSDSEVDHILPVYARPDLAFELSNLQAISVEAHRIKSAKESLESRYTVSFSKVKSVEFVGKVQTYDLEVDHPSHNYVANGMVTHNSQRYSTALTTEIYPARRQDLKNKQNSIDDMSDEDKQWFEQAQSDVHDQSFKLYQEALSRGIAKEQARFLLPLSTETTIYMSGSVRSWIHYIEVRTGPETQKEHRDIALACRDILKKELPDIAEALGW